MNKSRFPRRFVILKSTPVFLETVLTQTFIPETLDSVPQAITLDTLLTITLDTLLLANEILGHSIIHNLGHSTTHNSGFRTSGHSSTITLDTFLLANNLLYIPFFLLNKYSADRQWGSWKVIILIDGPHFI